MVLVVQVIIYRVTSTSMGWLLAL